MGLLEQLTKRPVPVALSHTRMPGQRYLGQCAHVWVPRMDHEIGFACLNIGPLKQPCNAICEMDERGRVTSYTAGCARDKADKASGGLQ